MSSIWKWGKKREGKEKKNVVPIAGQSELKVTVIFAQLILVQLQKKDLAPQPLKRFEEMRVCTWKSLLLSPIPTEETTNYPLFRALETRVQLSLPQMSWVTLGKPFRLAF